MPFGVKHGGLPNATAFRFLKTKRRRRPKIVTFCLISLTVVLLLEGIEMADGKRSTRHGKNLGRYPSGAKGLAVSKEQIAAVNCDLGEEMVKDDQQQPKLRLKNGAMADVEYALAILSSLRCLQDTEPKVFEAFQLVANGRPQDADPEQVACIPKGDFGPDGKLRPEITDVFFSSLQMSKEGPVLVNPFKLENKKDKLLVEKTAKEAARKDREFGKWMLRNMRDQSRE